MNHKMVEIISRVGKEIYYLFVTVINVISFKLGFILLLLLLLVFYKILGISKIKLAKIKMKNQT